MKIIDSMRFKVHKGKEKVKTFFEHHKTEFKYAAVATVIGAKYIIDAYRVSNLQSEKVNLEKDGSSNIEMGKKWYENIIFSFIYAIISMKVIY